MRGFARWLMNNITYGIFESKVADVKYCNPEESTKKLMGEFVDDYPRKG